MREPAALALLVRNHRHKLHRAREDFQIIAPQVLEKPLR
jgi:hypothetical protein